jgi:hypothetical protein
MLKKIIILIALLIALPLIAALFTPSSYHVEREVTINQPNPLVFGYIKLLKNQNNFSKWALIDPNMEKTYQGVDGTVGFISAWKSENPDVGQGEQEIINIKEGKRIDYELRFIEPFQSISPAYISTSVIDKNHTKVIWDFDGNLTYPMNIMLWFVDFEKVIGDDLQTGLDNLKVILEH